MFCVCEWEMLLIFDAHHPVWCDVIILRRPGVMGSHCPKLGWNSWETINCAHWMVDMLATYCPRLLWCGHFTQGLGETIGSPQSVVKEKKGNCHQFATVSFLSLTTERWVSQFLVSETKVLNCAHRCSHLTRIQKCPFLVILAKGQTNICTLMKLSHNWNLSIMPRTPHPTAHNQHNAVLCHHQVLSRPTHVAGLQSTRVCTDNWHVELNVKDLSQLNWSKQSGIGGISSGTFCPHSKWCHSLFAKLIKPQAQPQDIFQHKSCWEEVLLTGSHPWGSQPAISLSSQMPRLIWLSVTGWLMCSCLSAANFHFTVIGGSFRV